MKARPLRAPLALVLAVMMFFSGGGMLAYAAEDTPVLAEDGNPYNIGDIAAINRMIANNGFPLTLNAPDEWDTISAEEPEKPPIVTWRIVDGEYRATDLLIQNFGSGVLDLSALPALQWLCCEHSDISSINLSGLTKLTHLYLESLPNIKQADFSSLSNLSDLVCTDLDMQTMDLSLVTNLKILYIKDVNLTALDVSHQKGLTNLMCRNTKIEHLDLSGLTELSDLDCDSSNISNLDLSDNQKLDYLSFGRNPIESVIFPNGTTITNKRTTGGKVIPDEGTYYLISDDEYHDNYFFWRPIADDGYRFDHWISVPMEVTESFVPVEAAFRPTVRYDEPAQDYVLEPCFKPITYPVTITGGTVVGDTTEFAPGETVTIQADKAPEGKRFTRWTVLKDSSIGEYPELADETASRTTFPMTPNPVFITARFDAIIPEEPDPSTPEGILETVEQLDPADSDDLEKIRDLEKAYQEMTNISVNVLADNNTHGNFKNQVDKISVVGAAFNADPGETVSIHFSKPKNNVVIDGTRYKTNNAVQLDISLKKDGKDMTQLKVPVTITVPIPSGVADRDFWILHFADDGSYERITPIVNGDGTCTFTVNHFSIFAFVNDVNSTAVPEDNSTRSTESTHESERNSNTAAQEAAVDAIEAANDGKSTSKVQNVATASGTTVPAVPVKLYGLSASLSIDTMEAIATGKTGLKVNLDNGAAEVLIPAGFQMPQNPGVLAYPLGHQKDPYGANLMKAAVKEDNAKTEIHKLGGGTLPTTATVTIKTKLTGAVNIYRWDEDTRKASLVASATAQGGKVTFAAKQLGNFIVTTGTI